MFVCEKHAFNLSQGPFVGREQAKKIFIEKLNFLQEKISDNNSCGQTKLLVYYGIGGIGKSRLLHELDGVLKSESNFKNVYSVYYDFDEAQDMRLVLGRMKNIFVDKYDFQFPLFELAEYIYAKKIGETTESPTLKGYVDKSRFLKKLVNAFGAIPMVGIAAKFLAAADSGLAYFKDYFTRHSDEIKVIENMTSAELLKYLVYLFACDMRENLIRENKLIVIFLDTYEQLVNEMAVTGEQLNNDLWLRGPEGLVHNIPNVLWVIGGRETLKWGRVNSEWYDEIEHVKLNNLSYDEVEEFLVANNIEEKNLRTAIYRLTNGIPVYLRMCVDQYISLKSRGKKPEIADFDNDINFLSERFARYMDNNKKEIVYLLSCLGIWNDLMLKDIGYLIIPSFRILEYSSIKEFSFIEPFGENGFKMHPSVSNVFFRNCPEQIKKDVCNIAPKYVFEEMKKMGISDVNVFLNLQWLLQFADKHFRDNEAEFCNFYAHYMREIFRELNKSKQYNLTNLLLAAIKNLSEKSTGLLKALYFTEKSRVMNDQENFKEAGEYAQNAIEIYKKVNIKTDINMVAALQNFAISLINCENSLRACEILDEAIEIRKNIIGSDYPDELALIQDRVSALWYCSEHEKAIKYEILIIKKRCEVFGEQDMDMLRAKYNLANMYFMDAKYSLAIGIFEDVYNKLKNVFGAEHPEVLMVEKNKIICDKKYENERNNLFTRIDVYVQMLLKIKDRKLFFAKELRESVLGRIRYFNFDISDIVLVYDDAILNRFSTGFVMTNKAIFTSRNEEWKFADMVSIMYDGNAILCALKDGSKKNVFNPNNLNNEEKEFLKNYLQKVSKIL